MTVPAFSSVAAAAEPAPTEPGAVTSTPPEGGDPSAISGTNTGPEAGSVAPPTADPPAPPTNAGPPTLPPDRSETLAPEVPAPVPEPAAPPATEAAPPAEPAVDPTLLDSAEPEPEPVAPVATQPVSAGSPSGISPEERSAAIDAAYAARYRPDHNPARINIAGRVMFANVSGKERVNGRIGGASVDIGPAWNRVAVAATFSGWGGRIQLPEDTGAELNAMLGGGLTVGLGRLALMTHGYLDLRVGYDIYYGAVNQRSDAPLLVAAQDQDPRVVATLTENLLPHGPRARLDMGLIGSTNRRFFHGLGLSMGYQALVGSFRGEMPMSNMLTIGLSYWMG
ncbi:MAG: hypothetical protein AAGF11_38845 [Myxococcota bacterium]